MALQNYSYIGKGPIYGRNRGTTSGALPLGNCSSLQFSVETSEITQPDYTQAGGGLANKVDRIDSVGVNLTLLDLSPANLAIALRGTASEDITAATVVDEAHTAYAGALIALNFLPDTAQSVTVVINPGATPTSTTQDTDWTLTRAGITIIEGGAITDGVTIGVSYTKSKQSLVEAMTESATEFELVFDGLNEAQSGKAVTVRVHRLKFSPAQGLNLIGDEFAELALEGTALIDTGITGTGLSKYFRIATEN